MSKDPNENAQKGDVPDGSPTNKAEAAHVRIQPDIGDALYIECVSLFR